MESTKPSSVQLVEWFDDHFYKYIPTDEEKEKFGFAQIEYFPSTTTKLGAVAKPFLAHWRGDIGNREADLRVFEASESGSRIHNAWCVYGNGGVVIFQPHNHPNFTKNEIEEMIKDHETNGGYAVLQYQDEMYDVYKLAEWQKIVKPKIIASELIVYSLTNREAGTIDKVLDLEEGEYLVNGAKPLKLPKGRYVVDLKTGKSLDDDAFMQIADYAFMYEEMGLGEITGGLLLHTGSQVKKGIEGLATIHRTKEELNQDFQDFRNIASVWQRKFGDRKPKVFEFPAKLELEKENTDGS